MADTATGKYLRENSSQWKGGKYQDDQGYTFIMAATLPEVVQALVRPMMGKKKYVLEHRAVMAQILGRPLTPGDILHHANGTKDTNRPENLAIAQRSDHSKKHRKVEIELIQLRALVLELRAENQELRLKLEGFPWGGGTCLSP